MELSFIVSQFKIFLNLLLNSNYPKSIICVKLPQFKIFLSLSYKSTHQIEIINRDLTVYPVYHISKVQAPLK
jgi:hypothetical protein